ncbi:bidirectional hydrogenase complex protein HoxU [Paludisphaera borealis]|uniref:NADP-reducing hydrogenase subunit HndC n=1 Tax=Paludisphaera borealis TaxID=1387353 RepID=A0A1U7CSR2_9BACT|nr:bidirectional hydrogenase complex protein HoxU [Paludisphaera borealis]APW61936.1 NADP-reducing hydrogenase subunit HndC [Paludisphaera borealis]
MTIVTLQIDGKIVGAREGDTVLHAARSAGVDIPALCHLEGLTDVGSCRLCLVEVGDGKPMTPACVTAVAEGLDVRTDTERLRFHRRTVVELMFAAGNHACAVCVANGDCELQDAAVAVGMDHVGFEYQHKPLTVDVSHELFGVDHNRCILCTRCVRVCDEIEGARTWGVSGRGADARVATDLDQPWGDSPTCTSCGKCVMACPTGALFHRGDTVSGIDHRRDRLASLIAAREHKPWPV